MGTRKIHFARRATLFAAFVAFALATGALPSPADAKPGGGHRGGGHQVKVHKGGNYAYRRGHKAYRRGHQAYRRGHNYAGLFGALLGYGPNYARRAYYAPRRRAYVPQYKPSTHRGYGRPCHAVSKTGYDDYGRKAKIGGTMCYDSYGNSYVVKGSRYVIHYY